MSEPTATARFGLLRELFDLARAQRAALEADELERFQTMLLERDEIIAQLEVLTVAAASAELPDNIIAFPGAVGVDAEDVLALDTLIRGVLEHDRHNEQLLQARLEVLRSELPGFEAGRRSVARYGVDLPDSRFIDRVS